MLLSSQTVRRRLVKPLAGRRHEDDAAARCVHLFQRGKERLGPQQHALPAAIRRVIHLFVPAQTVLPQIMNTQRDSAFFLGPAHDAGPHGNSDEFWKKGDDVETHRCSYAFGCGPVQVA